MDELVTWLRAQLDEDERALYLAGATGERWPHPGFRWLINDIGAKRRIIDWAIKFMEGDYAPWNETCLRLMALPYADRPGYRDDWQPGLYE